MSDRVVMESKAGRVLHYCRDAEVVSLCGVELIRNPTSATAWALCRKCELLASAADRKETK